MLDIDILIKENEEAMRIHHEVMERILNRLEENENEKEDWPYMVSPLVFWHSWDDKIFVPFHIISNRIANSRYNTPCVLFAYCLQSVRCCLDKLVTTTYYRYKHRLRTQIE